MLIIDKYCGTAFQFDLFFVMNYKQAFVACVIFAVIIIAKSFIMSSVFYIMKKVRIFQKIKKFNKSINLFIVILSTYPFRSQILKVVATPKFIVWASKKVRLI